MSRPGLAEAIVDADAQRAGEQLTPEQSKQAVQQELVSMKTMDNKELSKYVSYALIAGGILASFMDESGKAGDLFHDSFNRQLDRNEDVKERAAAAEQAAAKNALDERRVAATETDIGSKVIDREETRELTKTKTEGLLEKWVNEAGLNSAKLDDARARTGILGSRLSMDVQDKNIKNNLANRKADQYDRRLDQWDAKLKQDAASGGGSGTGVSLSYEDNTKLASDVLSAKGIGVSKEVKQAVAARLPTIQKLAPDLSATQMVELALDEIKGEVSIQDTSIFNGWAGKDMKYSFDKRKEVLMILQERAAAKLASGANKKAPIVPLKERAEAAQAARDTSGSMLKSMVTKPQAAPSVLQSMAAASANNDPDSMSSNIGRATDRAQAAVGGTIEAIGQVTGSQYLKDKGDQIRTEQLAQAAEYGRPTQPRTYKDVEFSSPSSVTEWAGNLFQDSAPAMGTILAGSAAGANVGAPLGNYGKAIGGAVGALLTSAGINIGEVQNTIHEEDPNAESPWHSIIAGTGMATLDMAGASVLLKPLIKNLGEEVVYEGLVKQGLTKGVALDLIAGGSPEAVIGAAQGAIQHVGVQSGLDRDIDLDAMSEDVINGLIGGAVLGSSIRATTGAIGRISNNGMVDGEAFDRAVKEADTGPQSIMGKTWTAFGGRSTDMLKGLGNISTSAKDFLTSFNPD